ncbi:hypothetical protein [Pseudomonas sp.]|uniref:hypothetical protein n=1 Tax=Pseudomonas sp. TaxID=306 RepID=UPI00272A7D81|nr:hypothetical protein [Pseudomonas sp.]
MRTISAVLLLFVFSSPVPADLAVVTHPDTLVNSISRTELINIFMGRYRRMPSGETALPIDLDPLRARFYRALLDKDLAEIDSYWARLVFSGQTVPPVRIRHEAEALDYIRRHPGALGFLDADSVPTDLKVVMRLPERAAP